MFAKLKEKLVKAESASEEQIWEENYKVEQREKRENELLKISLYIDGKPLHEFVRNTDLSYFNDVGENLIRKSTFLLYFLYEENLTPEHFKTFICNEKRAGLDILELARQKYRKNTSTSTTLDSRTFIELYSWFMLDYFDDESNYSTGTFKHTEGTRLTLKQLCETE